MRRGLSRREFLSLSAVSLIAGCGGSSGTPAASGSSGEPAPLTLPEGNRTPNPHGSDTPPDALPGDNVRPEPPPAPNIVQRENAKTAEQGVTAQWQIADRNYASQDEIEGYASATSVNRGESIKLYVNTVDPEYTISIYRIGWYGGSGGRLVKGPIRLEGKRQPPPRHEEGTDLIECNWNASYEFNIPATPSDPTDWASGIYLAKLIGSRGKESYIIFVVRDDARKSDLLFQSSVTTYAAYNNWGGYNLYDSDGVDGKAAYKLSFNRPYRNPQRPFNGKGAGDFLSWEINMVRFLERYGYDVAYSTNIDTHVAPARLLQHRGFLSVGHDEYWTKSMRDALEAARDSGVNLAFFGANTGYWQVRLEDGGNGQPNRTMVAYKYATPAKDPMYESNPSLSTGLWRDAPINRPEAALVGVMYQYNSVDLDMVIDDCDRFGWIFADSGLRKGSLLKGMLGYEVDSVAPSSPGGIAILAKSPYRCDGDTGCPGPGDNYAHMTYYTARSGAGVFATGSMNWHWGLDSYDDGRHGNREMDPVKMVTNNILKRFVA